MLLRKEKKPSLSLTHANQVEQTDNQWKKNKGLDFYEISSKFWLIFPFALYLSLKKMIGFFYEENKNINLVFI